MNLLVDEPRLHLIADTLPDLRDAFARDFVAGLKEMPKRLSCRFLYDEEGSQLFEEICAQPEYYLTRAEAEILEENATAFTRLFDERPDVVELGSGSAVKTRRVLDAFLETFGELTYRPIDISRHALEDSGRALLEAFASLEVRGVAAEYVDGLRASASPDGRPRLVLWLGSSIGNFHRDEAAAFLTHVASTLTEKDALLVGMDLRKDRAVLEEAYDDAAGVTARFNKNLLARANRELGASFDLDAFRHRAHWNEEDGRVEMYLDSLREQDVAIEAFGESYRFFEGEATHTENSYKYGEAEIDALARAAGLVRGESWSDAENRFHLELFRTR